MSTAVLDVRAALPAPALSLAPAAVRLVVKASFGVVLLGLVTLKYTQSNSVCYVLDGQAIGIGAGQQSRVHCTRLAGAKADRWFLRQHPAVLDLPFYPKLGRPERANAADLFLEEELSPAEEAAWLDSRRMRS